jgi:hypothetical protein
VNKELVGNLMTKISLFLNFYYVDDESKMDVNAPQLMC